MGEARIHISSHPRESEPGSAGQLLRGRCVVVRAFRASMIRPWLTPKPLSVRFGMEVVGYFLLVIFYFSESLRPETGSGAL